MNFNISGIRSGVKEMIWDKTGIFNSSLRMVNGRVCKCFFGRNNPSTFLASRSAGYPACFLNATSF